MGFFDDLQARVNEVVPEGIRNDIGSYLQARVVDPVVKIGQPATGNLSAEQLASGARGGSTPVASPASPAVASMNAGAKSAFDTVKPYLPIIGLALVGGIVFSMVSRRARK